MDTKFDRTNVEHLTKWNIRRVQILNRDEFKCVKCGSPDALQIHHIKYYNKLQYWEYPDSYLETLCATCHTKEHASKPIADFYSKTRIKKRTGMGKLYKQILEG
jgi:5-methylcytosine-specific restriction endonuclease McrA